MERQPVACAEIKQQHHCVAQAPVQQHQCVAQAPAQQPSTCWQAKRTSYRDMDEMKKSGLRAFTITCRAARCRPAHRGY